METEEAGRLIVNCAYKVHTGIGPGLLESAYQTCLAYELRICGLRVDLEVTQPIEYREIKIDAGYRIDMLIENCVVVENKCVEQLLAIHKAQMLTYREYGIRGFWCVFGWRSHPKTHQPPFNSAIPN